MWALGVPLALHAALVLRWDVEYVYLVSTAEYVAKAIFGIWRLRSGKWIHNLVEG
jgi:Na+-driven multidrug efflux pump